MTQTVQTNAYVLRTVNYGDRDIVVTLFAPEMGKVSAIARSARASKKRFAGGIEPFTLMNAQLKIRPGRDLALLLETDVKNGHPKIREDFDKITIASYATEITAAFAQEGESQPKLFDLLNRFYASLESAPHETLNASLLGFELELLTVSGFGPTLRACATCGESMKDWEKFRMSRNGEGLLCGSCSARQQTGVVERGAMEILWYLAEGNDDPPEELVDHAKLAQARRVVWASLARVVDYELKSMPMLEEFLSSG